MEEEAVNLDIKPFSVNEAWKGTRRKTAKYSDFEQEVLFKLPQLTIPPDAKLALTFWFGFSSKAADYDNPIKPMQDILQKAYEFDDKMIFEGRQFKRLVPKGEEYIKFLLEIID